MISNYINHIALVLDASGSMSGLRRDLVAVADEQVKYLAQRSKELDQETRVSIYSFDDRVRCLVWDKDVLRLPSIKELYSIGGMTALVDATLLALDDFNLVSEKYGDHSFLEFVLTDGAENSSRSRPDTLARRLEQLPENRTVAVLVPNQIGVHEAKRFGFPKDNIAIWDATSTAGIVEAGATIRTATDNFMVARASGVRSTRSLFSTGADAVNAQTIQQAGLQPLGAGDYRLVPVPREAIIRPFIEECGLRFQVGKAYYQLMKTETIQSQKEVAVVDKKSDKVYVGRNARQLLGLPDMNVRVKPDKNPDWDIYVQSSSVNRKLIAGTKLLVLMS